VPEQRCARFGLPETCVSTKQALPSPHQSGQNRIVRTERHLCFGRLIRPITLCKKKTAFFWQEFRQYLFKVLCPSRHFRRPKQAPRHSGRYTQRCAGTALRSFRPTRDMRYHEANIAVATSLGDQNKAVRTERHLSFARLIRPLMPCRKKRRF
jgi:hypothetical protein